MKLKKVVSVLLALTLFICAMPVEKNIVAATKEEDYGLSNPKTEGDSTTTWDCVYFGNYPQSKYTPKQAPANPISGQEYTDSDGTKMMYQEWEREEYNKEKYDYEKVKYQGYFKVEPIKWRVLSVDGEDAFLMADSILDSQCFNEKHWEDKNGNGKKEEDEIITWKDSSIRSWLNNEFYLTAFTEAERAAVLESTNENEGESSEKETHGYFLFPDGGTTQDKVYLPSRAEIKKEVYGLPDNCIGTVNRLASNTDYAKKTLRRDYQSYWLRAPQAYAVYEGIISYSVRMDVDEYPVVDDYDGVRPAVHLKLSDKIWSKTDPVSTKSIEKTYHYQIDNQQISLYHMSNGQAYAKIGDEKEFSVWSDTEQIGLGRDGMFYFLENNTAHYGFDGTYGEEEENFNVVQYLKNFNSGSPCYSLTEDGLDTTDYAGNVKELIYDDENYVIGYKTLDGKTLNVLSYEEMQKMKKKNENDVAILQKIIEAQKALGASIEEDISDSWHYEWNLAGRLTKISWRGVGLKGAISLEGLDGLQSFDCSNNELTYLDVSKNMKLRYLDYEGNPGGLVINKSSEQKPSPTPVSTKKPVATPTPTNTPSVSDKSVSVANSKVAIKSVKNKKGKKVAASWKKVTGASGYQIAYSTNKKFKSKKTKNVAKTTVTLSKLKKKKTYYIKVRAYTKVNGKKVYGKWSAVKKVKVKR